MSHKHQVGELVRLAHPNFRDERSKDIYEVTRLMPADETGELSYRIKAPGATERAVRESEITGAASAGNEPESSTFKAPSVQPRS
jgi:hypothetical protein